MVTEMFLMNDYSIWRLNYNLLDYNKHKKGKHFFLADETRQHLELDLIDEMSQHF